MGAESMPEGAKERAGEKWQDKLAGFADDAKSVLSVVGGAGAGAFAGSKFGPGGIMIGGAIGLGAGLFGAARAQAEKLQRNRTRDIHEGQFA